MSIVITVNQKGARAETIEKLVGAAIKAKFPDAFISVTRKEPAESRSDRFAEMQGDVISAKSDAEGLKDELQEWYDNLPENFQSGEKGSQLEEAMSQLGEFIDACDTAENVSVDFPGMY
jgi:hypothetical protein